MVKKMAYFENQPKINPSRRAKHACCAWEDFIYGFYLECLNNKNLDISKEHFKKIIIPFWKEGLTGSEAAITFIDNMP